MKTVILTFFFLVACSVVTILTRHAALNELPILYWVVDPAPARTLQIEQFLVWQIRHKHGDVHVLKTPGDVADFRKRFWSPGAVQAMEEANPGAEEVWNAVPGAMKLPITVRAPLVDMEVDAVNNSIEKKLIQGLSGVCGDIIDTYNGGSELEYLASAHMLLDLSPYAAKGGFDPSKTYPALAGVLTEDGRQLGYPRNVTQMMYWVNKDIFKRYGQPLPPRRWDLQTFEKLGKRFVAAANRGVGRGDEIFFADTVDMTELRRSLGLSEFNETMTKCTLDDPRNAEVLSSVYRWTYVDHILPSGADMASFATQGNWGGQSFQMFYNGNFGLMMSGRWALVQFRQFGAMRLGVVEAPNGGFPNSVLSGAIDTVFTRSAHREGAALFMAYLASREYNMQIVDDGDALPPNPAFAETELFKHPPLYPNEWGCHEVFLDDALHAGIPQSFSPFVLPTVVQLIDLESQQSYMADRITAAGAGQEAAQRINAEIRRTVAERKDLAPLYRGLLADQARIDALKAAGKKIPRALITNPFYLRYDAEQGRLEGKP